MLGHQNMIKSSMAVVDNPNRLGDWEGRISRLLDGYLPHASQNQGQGMVVGPKIFACPNSCCHSPITTGFLHDLSSHEDKLTMPRGMAKTSWPSRHLDPNATIYYKSQDRHQHASIRSTPPSHSRVRW